MPSYSPFFLLFFFLSLSPLRGENERHGEEIREGKLVMLLFVSFSLTSFCFVIYLYCLYLFLGLVSLLYAGHGKEIRKEILGENSLLHSFLNIFSLFILHVSHSLSASVSLAFPFSTYRENEK